MKIVPNINVRIIIIPLPLSAIIPLSIWQTHQRHFATRHGSGSSRNKSSQWEGAMWGGVIEWHVDI
jgi:hypothetical protein